MVGANYGGGVGGIQASFYYELNACVALSFQENILLKRRRESSIFLYRTSAIRGNLDQLQVFLMVLAAYMFTSNRGSD